MMTESTAGQPYLIIRVGHSMLYNTKVYIFHFVCSADHIWLKHIALSPSISYSGPEQSMKSIIDGNR